MTGERDQTQLMTGERPWETPDWDFATSKTRWAPGKQE